MQDPEFYALSRRLKAYADILNQGDTVIIPADAKFIRFLINNELPPAAVVKQPTE